MCIQRHLNIFNDYSISFLNNKPKLKKILLDNNDSFHYELYKPNKQYLRTKYVWNTICIKIVLNQMKFDY